MCFAGNENPAMVEYAPFQKIPKRSGGKKKDVRCGTIDDDADYLSFLETLTKPVTITLPPLEAVLEEIQAHDRELKGRTSFYLLYAITIHCQSSVIDI